MEATSPETSAGKKRTLVTAVTVLVVVALLVGTLVHFTDSDSIAGESDETSNTTAPVDEKESPDSSHSKSDSSHSKSETSHSKSSESHSQSSSSKSKPEKIHDVFFLAASTHKAGSTSLFEWTTRNLHLPKSVTKKRAHLHFAGNACSIHSFSKRKQADIPSVKSWLCDKNTQDREHIGPKMATISPGHLAVWLVSYRDTVSRVLSQIKQHYKIRLPIARRLTKLANMRKFLAQTAVGCDTFTDDASSESDPHWCSLDHLNSLDIKKMPATGGAEWYLRANQLQLLCSEHFFGVKLPNVKDHLETVEHHPGLLVLKTTVEEMGGNGFIRDWGHAIKQLVGKSTTVPATLPHANPAPEANAAAYQMIEDNYWKALTPHHVHRWYRCDGAYLRRFYSEDTIAHMRGKALAHLH